VDKADLELRNHAYARFVELGRAPSFHELADGLGRPLEDVGAGMRRLHDAHAVVLAPKGESIRMANPFSAVPTPHRVRAAGREWYGNCAWDAFGILAALDVDGQVSSSCADCGAPVELEVRDRRLVDGDHVFHVNVPAAHWWDDIVFT
jgi:hypothetical protein